MRAATKILIALQFWEGDKLQADALARFLADLEPRHTDLADFLFVHRHDCVFPTGLDKYVSRKFNTFVYRAARGNTGWPAGCNTLWTNTITWAKTMSQARRVPAYKAIFTCESDGGPVYQDWIARLSQAWNVANHPRPVCVAGPVVSIPARHMNGNLLVSGEAGTLNWIHRLALGVTSTMGWDWVLSPQFEKRGWANIPGMVSYYNSRTFSVEQYRKMQADQLIWVHGIKDNSLIDLGREFLMGGMPAL